MDMDKLQQALFNFVKNAMESISGDGIITLSIRNTEKGRVEHPGIRNGVWHDDRRSGEDFQTPNTQPRRRGWDSAFPLRTRSSAVMGARSAFLSRKGSGRPSRSCFPRKDTTTRGRKAHEEAQHPGGGRRPVATGDAPGLPSEEGHTVGEAGNGERAVQCVREGHYDLLLLDYKMPGMDGMQVLQAVKGINPEIDVVIITAYGRSRRPWTP